MKRIIKFRGWFQSIDGKEYWVYGYLVKVLKRKFFEITNGESSWTVINEGQYTGLNDDYNKEIYEGDIVGTAYGVFTVEFNDDTCKFQFSNGMDINDGEMYGMSKCVLGNIYENPDAFITPKPA